MLINLINLLFIITSAQPYEAQERVLKNITVTQGIYSDRIVVEWEKKEGASYNVIRSQFKNSGFTPVAQVADSKFEDRDVEAGVKYWYKVIHPAEISSEEEMFITDDEYNSIPEPEITDISINKTDDKNSARPAVSYSGYTSIKNFKGVTLNALMKQKKANLKNPSGAEEKLKQKKNLDYIKQYYMNPVKLSLFMTMARPYFDKGDLNILTGCDTFEMKKDFNRIIFYDNNYRYIAVFESKKYIRILTESNDEDLAETLIKNSELFCIAGGKTFIVDKNGITRLVNSFDAVGLSTGYLKNDKEWRSRTIMLSTSRSDLKDKLKSVSQPEAD